MAHEDGARLEPVRFIVYSDYLCPWCFNASVRLHRLEEENPGRVELVWRSYLLRPEPRAADPSGEALEKFRRYTRSWLRPAAEADSGEFRVWEGDEAPPSHSIPAHVVAKAAARIDSLAFRRLHLRLLRAYFAENRDISDPQTLRACWGDSGLASERFSESEDPSLVQEVLADHREALDCGATGVPGVRLDGNPAVIVGAQPLELYQRWLDRTIPRRLSAES